MKTGQSRLDDTLNYLRQNNQIDLADHILNIIRAHNPSRIGDELSLGGRKDDPKSPQYNINTKQRHALRALLLCQRVYFSDLWAQLTLVGGAQIPFNLLNPDWKRTSLVYWGQRNEKQIIEGISTFIITENRTEALAQAANSIPRGNHPSYTLTRSAVPFPGMISCYGAVMTWLFKSGLVSYRWYLKNSGANNEKTLREAFGPAEVIWPGDKLFSVKDSLPEVKRGHIIHLYVNNNLRWTGHWLVSLGEGLASACNNDTADETPNDWSDKCNLNRQFLNGYKHKLGNDNSPKYENGIAEIIDPLKIPGRV